MSFTLAIVGRPNVGKSTLFNRLVGKRLALVDDQPGVTRDLREGQGRLGALKFTVTDTAGFENVSDDSLRSRMRRLTEKAVAQVDLCLFLIDGRVGVTSADKFFADILRKQASKVILAVNKCEGQAGEEGFYEGFSLGLGDPIRISAEHGIGLDELMYVLEPIVNNHQIELKSPLIGVPVFDEDLDESEDYNSTSQLTSGSSVMQVAVVGRPNAGKSTLVNKILGEDRLLTGPEAGITRDAISISITWNGTKFRIFDTAGMRKRAKVNEKIEKLSVSDGLRAVNFSEVVVILLDVENPFEVQDLRIADLAEREGRAVVVAINKWDLEKQKQKQTKVLLEKFYRLLPQLKGAPLISVSAKTGAGLNRLYDAIIKAYTVWNIRVPTARLNRWLDEIVSAHPPPAPGGRRIRLRYMTQAKTRPPTFVIFCSRANELPASYSRYLVNGLRIYFDLPGTPIRLIIKSGENPYAEKAKKRKLG
jgi:GTP-binding protein